MKKYIGKEEFEFAGVQVTAMYYLEDGLYSFRLTHVIKEPNGTLYKPGGETSFDPNMEHLKFKLHHVYLSSGNFYEGCEMVFNEDF